MAFKRYFGGKTKSRSGREEKVKKNLTERGIKFTYESLKLLYTKKSCPHCSGVVDTGVYTPDFVIERSSGVPLVIEYKGKFDSQDRSKHVLVKRDNPGIDLRFLFQRDQPICKGSRTSYTQWCDKRGFKWAIGEVVPEGWLK